MQKFTIMEKSLVKYVNNLASKHGVASLNVWPNRDLFIPQKILVLNRINNNFIHNRYPQVASSVLIVKSCSPTFLDLWLTFLKMYNI